MRQEQQSVEYEEYLSHGECVLWNVTLEFGRWVWWWREREERRNWMMDIRAWSHECVLGRVGDLCVNGELIVKNGFRMWRA